MVHHVGGAGFTYSHAQRRVRRLVIEDIELTLELFDLALKVVQLVLDGENAADRGRLFHNCQVLLAARLEGGDACREIDVLGRHVG